MNGWTPLYIACRSYGASNEIIKYLLDCKANTNVEWKGESCIQNYLCRSKIEIEVLKKFKENGCQFKRRNNKGESVLQTLFQNRKTTLEIVRFFVEECGVDYKDSLKEISFYQKESFDVFKHFFKENLNFQVISNYFSDDLNLLLYKYLDTYERDIDIRFLKLFVDLKANVNPFPGDNEKNLIFVYTRYNYQLEIIQYLVDLKVNPDVKTLSRNPLHNLLNSHATLDSVKFILENTNFSVKEKTSAFANYISYVYDKQNLDENLFFLMVLHGADLNSKTKSWQGETTISESSRKNEKCVRIIQNFESNKVWDTKYFTLFPLSLQLEIENLLICIKDKYLKFPKPLLHLIFNFVCQNFHKQKLN